MSIRRRAVLAAAGVLAMGTRAHAADPAAAAPIEALNQALVGAMKAGKAAPFTQRFNQIAPAVDGAFDLNGVLAASIGPRLATIPAPQQAALLAIFRKFTIASYASSFDSFSGERLTMLPDQRSVGDDVVVATQIAPAQGAPTRIDYVMRRGPKGWRAVDVLLDGSISQNAVKRSDFRSLVSASSAQPLIDSLQRKVAELSGGSVS